jgi:hypothetical protein
MPSSLTFSVDQIQTQSDLAPGTSNDSAEQVLRKFLNPSLVGPGWDALIAAIAAGDQANWANALAAFDQLFLSTASGKYLERAAANYGEVKPATVGMSDDVFRALSIIKKNKKLTQEAFLEVLEVFYGPEAVRGVSTSTGAEPFTLVDQDTLILLLDEKVTVTVTFDRTHYTSIGAASALEVSGEINRALSEAGSNAYAIAYNDPTASGTFVRVYSGSRGLSSSVRVLGGSAQRWLQFPTPLFDIADFSSTTWTVSSPTSGVARFSTSDVGFDLSKVRIDDIVCIFGGPTDPFAVAGIQGTFSITAVDKYYVVASGSPTPHQYFEIAYVAVPVGTYPQDFTGLMFFRPTKATLYDQQRHVIVTQLGKVELPATTNIVRRGPGSGAYLNAQDPVSLVSLTRAPSGVVTGATAAAHGMSVGDQVFIDGARPTGAAPPVSAGTPSGDFSSNVATGTTNASLQSTGSEADTVQAVNHKMVRTAEGLLMLVGGMTQTSPGSNTAIANPKIFEITSDTVLGNGGRQLGYKWTDLVTHTQTVGKRGIGASALLDGRVLVTGGTNSNTDVSGTAVNGWDLYTYTNAPAQNLLTSGTLPAVKAGHGQCTLSGGNVLIGGGWSGGSVVATSYTFDPATSAWTARGSLVRARMWHQLVALASGDGLAIGGVDGASNILNSVERYSVAGHTWASVASMTYARRDFGSLVLPDGRVLVVGGTGGNATQNSFNNTLASCEIYDPGTGLWAPLPPMSVGRVFPVVSYLPSRNAVFVVGGGSTLVEMLDIATMRWSRSRAALGAGLTASAGALAATDAFVVVGGLQNANNTVKLNYVVVPGSDVVWTGGLNRQATIASVPTSTQFTYSVTDANYRTPYVSATGATVTPSKALPSPAGLPGPFSFDPQAGLSVTGTVATLGQAINDSQSYSVFKLDTGIDSDPALLFPDQVGYLVFDFGFKGQVGPVKYLGRFDNVSLMLDASFRFPKSIASGVTVTLLQSNTPFRPDPNADPLTGNFYLTSSSAGRIAAGAALDDIQAAGLAIKRKVVYPNDVGLGNAGDPTSGAQKLSDATVVWGGDDLDNELPSLREGD